jgi:hypothetical protein
MEYTLELYRPYKYRHAKRGYIEILPGVYNVPDDVAEGAARIAVDRGIAKLRGAVKSAPIELVTPKRKYTKRAPLNKALNVPQNKSALG